MEKEEWILWDHTVCGGIRVLDPAKLRDCEA